MPKVAVTLSFFFSLFFQFVGVTYLQKCALNIQVYFQLSTRDQVKALHLPQNNYDRILLTFLDSFHLSNATD